MDLMNHEETKDTKGEEEEGRELPIKYIAILNEMWTSLVFLPLCLYGMANATLRYR